jgi:cellulose synthase operon protein C
MLRPLFLLALSASTAIAASPVTDISPRSQADRFLPEDLPALAAPAYYREFEKARDLLHFGRYKAALYASFNLAGADATDIALLRAECYWRLGHADLARSTLAGKDDPRATLLLAKIDLADGRATDAIAKLKPRVDADPNAVAPRHYLAVALEDAGKLDAAIEQHKFLAEGPESVLTKFESDGAIAFESAEDLTLAAESIDRWAAVSGQYAAQQALHQTVLAMFVAAYDTVDRSYWPAHVAAARYFARHGNKKDAYAELAVANAANPNSEEVNALLGEVMPDGQQAAGVEKGIAAIREVNPNSIVADALDVELKLQRRSFDAALKLAEHLVARQPQNIDALAHLAAVYAARGDTELLNATLAKVDAIDPKDATARLMVGQTLASVYYDAGGAIAFLQEAIDRAPWWTEPQHALGFAYLQTGEEDDARRVLDKAYAVDPYNLLTVNYLRVLDMLVKFRTSESERFIFKYAEPEDPIVPLYVGPAMDAMYDELVADFKFSPSKKPIVEVFPDKQTFSVRTAGLTGLETYGASLGRVMTVVAPRAGETLGPFNWARILRHEFTHTINLMQTKGRVPRWLTEGLAVWEEHVPYRFAWVPPAMYERATKDEMFTPREMMDALTRPKRPNDGEIAYMTGFWVVRCIDETIGWDAVLKLLAAYGDGKGDDDAFKAATGMNVADFHTKFSAWAKNEVKDWGYDEATTKEVEAITKEAERLTRESQWEPAVEAWQKIVDKQPMNPMPPRRLAGIYLRLERPEEALTQLLITLPLELQDNRFAKRIARIYDDTGDAKNALKYANAAIGIDPYDAEAHDLLGELAQKAGDSAKVKQESEVAALLRERKEKARAKQP